MILTSYFAIEPSHIRGGIGNRYVGLYGSLVKALLNHSLEAKIFWFSKNDQSLRILSQTGVQKTRASMVQAVLSCISITLRSESYIAIIVAYPYAIPKVDKLIEYILSLLVLKIFSLCSRIRVIIDVIDPPVEVVYAFSEVEPSIFTIVYHRIIDTFTLKLASLIITHSGSYKRYIANFYQIKEQKIIVVPPGALLKHIPCLSPKFREHLTVLYAGSAMKVKDVDKLVYVIGKLRRRGIKMDLNITGAKFMDLPSWVIVDHYDWPSYVNRCLSKADVCVIPYPPDKLHFSLTMLAKTQDYMAAGKPIISTNLRETGEVIRKYNCGLVAENWEEFEFYLKKLYYDRELAKKLGENGYRAVNRYFNYEYLAETLLAKLSKTFISDYP